MVLVIDMDGVGSDIRGWDVAGILLSVEVKLTVDGIAFWSGKGDLDLGIRIRISSIDMEIRGDAFGLIGELDLVVGSEFRKEYVPSILEELLAFLAVPKLIGPSAEIGSE